jgi:hypothetical protein
MSIQNMDELLESGIYLDFQTEYNFIFQKDDETQLSKVQLNFVKSLSFLHFVECAVYQKNVSIWMFDTVAKEN